MAKSSVAKQVSAEDQSGSETPSIVNLFSSEESSIVGDLTEVERDLGLNPNSPAMVHSILSEIAMEKAKPKIRKALKSYQKVATSKWDEETHGFHIKKAV